MYTQASHKDLLWWSPVSFRCSPVSGGVRPASTEVDAACLFVEGEGPSLAGEIGVAIFVS